MTIAFRHSLPEVGTPAKTSEGEGVVVFCDRVRVDDDWPMSIHVLIGDEVVYFNEQLNKVYARRPAETKDYDRARTR